MEIISFVILHYKDRKTTDACVQSILHMDNQERIRIIIVDNDVGEPMEKRRKLADCYKANSRITVLPIQENGGFSYANNQGYCFAREKQNASYIIVLNNDIAFTQPDFPKRLDKSYEQHPCHILGPDVIRGSTKEHQNPMDTRLRTKEEAEYTVRMNRLALRFYPILYPLLYWKLKKEEQSRLVQKQAKEQFYRTVQENIVPFGACLIFTSDFVKQETKAFTPETKFFYEEYILTHRCRKKGYRIVYDPALRVIHEGGAATKTSFHSERKRMRFMMERTAEAAERYLEVIE